MNNKVVTLNYPRRVRLVLAAATFLLSACGDSGTATNYDRSSSFTDIISDLDRRDVSDLSRHIGEGTLSGTATYKGVGAATFGADFTGTADATLVADFDNETIRGSLTNWEDGSPRTHDLRGEIVLSNGALERSLDDELDGTFSGVVTGNLERTRLAEIDPSTGQTIFYDPVVLVLDGVAEGAFVDSSSGDPASRVIGDMNAAYATNTGQTGTMTGGFAAEK